MRHNRRKTVQLLAAFLAIAFMYFLPGQGTLARAEEADAGGTREDAKTIELGKTYSETTSSRDDEDFFKFTATEHGYFQVNLNQNAADASWVGSGWQVKVLDQQGNEIISDSYVKNSWTSVAIPYAEPGRVLYVQVMPQDSNVAPVGCIYDLTVKQIASSDWELEPNGTRADANAIEADKAYHGITLNSNDVDVFRLKTSVNGYFQVQFGQNAADGNYTSNGWEINVLDEQGEVITAGQYITKNWASMILPYAQAGRTFYIQVMPQNSNTPPFQCMYDLTVKQTSAADWESEPNGTMKTATAIKSGKTYNGNTDTSSDEDFYKLNVPASGKVRVLFSSHNSNPSDSVGRGWDILVYDKKSNEVARTQEIETAGSVAFDVKKGTYYIKIEPSSVWSAPEGCRYAIWADYAKTPSTPKVSSVKAGKKSAVVKWKKVSGASGYYVYRSTSKKSGFKKVRTLKKASALSWKDKKLKSGRKYYYKVAAYKKIEGITVVSPYSAVKSVKVK